MANTTKGFLTQEKILKAAKRLFYSHGLNQVSVSSICKEADIKLGTFTYYFPKKDDLINALYNSYMENIQKYVKEQAPDLNETEHYLTTILLYYFHIYSDVNISRFHQEILQHSSMNPIFSDSRLLIQPFLKECRSELTDSELDLFVIADNASRRELSLTYLQQPIRDLESILDLYKKVYTVSAKLFDFPLDLLKLHIENAYDFLLKHIDENLSLLRS